MPKATKRVQAIYEAAIAYASRLHRSGDGYTASETQDLLDAAADAFELCPICDGDGWGGPAPAGNWRAPGGTDTSLPVRPLCQRCRGRCVVEVRA